MKKYNIPKLTKVLLIFFCLFLMQKTQEFEENCKHLNRIKMLFKFKAKSLRDSLKNFKN